MIRLFGIAIGRDWLAAAMIAAFVLIGLWFSFAVPPFETPDELYHYGYTRHLAQGNGLPVIDPALEEDAATPWAHEGGQAPLYYLLVGALTAGVDQRDFDEIRTINPRANLGDPLFAGNKNFLLYSSVDWPLRGVNLALHVGRWLSLALATITLLLIYRLARMAFPQSNSLPLLALALVASLPQFVFISASLSNDNAVILTSTAAVWWLARLTPRPPLQNGKGGCVPDQRADWFSLRGNWQWLVLGVLLGLAALSKLQGLGVSLLAGLVILWLAIRARDWRLLGRAALWVGVPALAIAVWWYMRNLWLYGDLFGASDLLAIEGLRNGTFFSGDFSGELRGLRYSFWGLFGWFNLPLPRLAYWLLDAATLLILGGLLLAISQKVFRTRQHAEARGFLSPFPNSPTPQFPTVSLPTIFLLAVWLLILAAMLAYWLSGAISSQGRLLFPSLAAFGVLGALGLATWARLLPIRWRAMVLWALPALLAVCTIFAVVWLIPHAYTPPPPIGDSLAAIPERASTVDLRVGDPSDGGDALELVAIDLPPVDQRFAVGEHVPVTLYLRTPTGVSHDYQLFIQFLDERGVEVANLTTHPGWGANPTSLWTPGAIYADRYPVLVQGPLDGRALAQPLLARVYVGFIDPATEETGRLALPVYDAKGEPLTSAAIVGEVIVTPSDWPRIPSALENSVLAQDVQFGTALRLTGAALSAQTLRAGQTLTTMLRWGAIERPAADYTVSVQILDANGDYVEGFDLPLAPGFPTSLWQADDYAQVEMPVALPENLAAGEYGVWVNLYDAASGARVPISAAGELEAINEQVRIGQITVQ